MKVIFNIFRLISCEISPAWCERYTVQMLPSLYKVCEGFAGKDISGESCPSQMKFNLYVLQFASCSVSLFIHIIERLRSILRMSEY